MKKQLLNELEKEAPFRQNLKEEIINEAYRSSRKRLPWKIVTAAGTIAVALAAFLFLNLSIPKVSQYDSSAKVEHKAATIIEEIVSIEGSKLNERFFQLSSEDELFLTSIYNSKVWEPIGEEKVGYEQLELSVTTAGTNERQPLVLLYKQQQGYTTLYSMKGKLTLNVIEMEQFNKLVNNAFTYTKMEKSWYIDEVISYQLEVNSPEDDLEKVNKLKGILKEAIFSTGTVIDTKDYPDGYIDLFTALDSKYTYRLNYWVEREKIRIDARTGIGEITGEAMYQFIQFLIEEGVYHNGVRIVTREDSELNNSLLDKLATLPNHSYKETVQTPNYILDLNGEVYFFTILDDTNQLITDFSKAYTLSDFEDEINTLRDKSETELNNFMEKRSWKTGEVLMSTKLDFSFSWNGNMFQVFENGVMIGRVSDGRVWIDLTVTEVETLDQLVRELK